MLALDPFHSATYLVQYWTIADCHVLVRGAAWREGVYPVQEKWSRVHYQE